MAAKRTDLYASGALDAGWNNDVLDPAFHGLTTEDFEVITLGWVSAGSGVLQGFACSCTVPREKLRRRVEFRSPRSSPSVEAGERPAIEGGGGRDVLRKGDTTMRFMILVKATQQSEAGVLPDEKLLSEMGRFNEELVKAGIMLAGEGLHSSAKGARVRFSGARRTVIDGPFTETKELVAGYWIWRTKSLAEAIEWVKRCPNPFPTDSEIEIRQVFEAEDFGKEFTPELREQENRLRAEIEGRR